MRTPTLPAADKEVFGNRRCSCLCCCWGGPKKTQVWGELLTSGEGETEFIGLVIVFARCKSDKVAFKVKPAGHCCGSGVWGVWRGYGVHVWLPPLFSSRLSLKFIRKNFINSFKHESFYFFLPVFEWYWIKEYWDPARGSMDAQL